MYLPHCKYLNFAATILSPTFLLLIGMIAIHFLPTYFQITNSVAGTGASINATGSLYGIHTAVLLLGLGLILYVTHGETAMQWVRDFTINILMPFYIFLVLLASFQYFTVGEVRYYFIKSSLLLELLLLTLLVAIITHLYTQNKFNTTLDNKAGLLKYWYVMAIPFLVIFSTIATNTNPLADTRALFRGYSHQAKPTFFDSDITTYVGLGQAGKINNFNSTLLHYDTQKGKLYAHMQISYWANTMGFGAAPLESRARVCSLELYGNLDFGTFSDAEQLRAVDIIKSCAKIAHEAGQPYYIVTDKDSVSKIAKLFGSAVTIRSNE